MIHEPWNPFRTPSGISKLCSCACEIKFLPPPPPSAFQTCWLSKHSRFSSDSLALLPMLSVTLTDNARQTCWCFVAVFFFRIERTECSFKDQFTLYFLRTRKQRAGEERERWEEGKKRVFVGSLFENFDPSIGRVRCGRLWLSVLVGFR